MDLLVSFCHVAMAVEIQGDAESAHATLRHIAERGLEAQVLQRGKVPTGLVFAYIEGYLPGGQHLELIEMQEATRQAFAGMEAASQRWDGADPVRSITRIPQDLTGQ